MAENSIEIVNFVANSPEVTLRVPRLHIRTGEFCALVAKSGSGKSVLLSVLSGHLLEPWMRKKSQVHFEEFRIGQTTLQTEAFSAPELLREGLGAENIVFLPQKLPLDRSLRRRTLAEMADVVSAIAPECSRRAAKRRLTERCEKMGLRNILLQPLISLSGGERRRVEIVARLTGIELQSSDREGSKEHVLLCLDEPTSGLDPSAQRRYYSFLRDTRQLFSEFSLTIVCATHDLDILEAGERNHQDRIFDSVAYVRKKEDEMGRKTCSLAWHGDTSGFSGSRWIHEIKGDESLTSDLFEPLPLENTAGESPSAGKTLTPPGEKKRKVKYTFGTELVRAWGKQVVGRGKWLAAAIPVLVGLIVFAAFLAREDTSRERFLFFSTIYAFWIGLFNSCQIVNGAVATGEWNYWVLGLRRSFIRYIQANSLVSLWVSITQLALFTLTVFAFSYFWGQYNPLERDSLFNVFVNPSELPTFFIEDVAGISPELLVVVLFCGSLLCAAIAGVGIGTLISCVADDTQGALKTAVGVVVVSMIASTTVLKVEGQASPASPPLWLKWHLRQYLGTPFFTTQAAPENRRLPHILEDASLILPQRYFFNIGRVLDEKVLSYVDYPSRRLGAPRKFDDYTLPPDSPTASNWENWKEIGGVEKLEAVIGRLNQQGERLHEEQFAILLAKVAGVEICACLGLAMIFFSCGVITARNKKALYELH